MSPENANDHRDPDVHPDDDRTTPTRPQTWRERHAIALMGGTLAALLGLVIFVQVGC